MTYIIRKPIKFWFGIRFLFLRNGVKPVDFALKAVTSIFNAKSTGFTSTKMSFDLIFSKFTAVSQKQKTYSEPEFYGLSNDIGHEV
ncbi:hypothetical protein B9Z55_018024 [Caenorhabditis nigoni]|uniref:Uncharacterized protein n=1 Tax=Caenorhabditis nigoni TaxID=1611254 RepID=A0A2G5TCE8_9PELO|nr:hypothetical protein B9Z55_018024 [Caenorhabditis nigoni]